MSPATPTERSYNVRWVGELLDQLADAARALAATLDELAAAVGEVPSKAHPQVSALVARALREVGRLGASYELALMVEVARDADVAHANEITAALAYAEREAAR